MTQKIYLAGKVGHHDWRHSLCPDLHGSEIIPSLGFPELTIQVDGVDAVSTGPVFISCDHGCYHGNNNHGVGAESDAWGCGSSPSIGQKTVHYLCEQAIRKSHTVFAWIEDQA